MKKGYRFVGSACAIWGVAELSKFGQRIELLDEVAENVILGGAALITEEDFNVIGFSTDELTDFAFPGQRVNAPEDFKARETAAVLVFQNRRHDLQAARFGGNE